MTGCPSSDEHFFKSSKKLILDQVNYDPAERKGTCTLNSRNSTFIMVWSIQDFPMETPSMPGSPYPIKFTFTIFKHNDTSGISTDRSLKSVSGEFIFEINSGTLPIYNVLGIPNGKYYTLTRNNYCQHTTPILFSLSENCMKILIGI